MLLAQSLRPIAAGVVLGLAGGFGLSQALNAIFFRMAGADPVAFALVSVLMLSAALLAAWVPVHRVTRVDPQRALRQA